jgi:hypothetical protein
MVFEHADQLLTDHASGADNSYSIFFLHHP